MLHPKKTTNVNYQLPQATTRDNMIKSYQKDPIELDFRFYVLLSELHKDLLYVHSVHKNWAN